MTLNQAWQTLQKIEGVRIDPVYGPPRPGDVRDSQADTTRAVADLGHAPRYSFEEGLRLTLEWLLSAQLGTARTPPAATAPLNIASIFFRRVILFSSCVGVSLPKIPTSFAPGNAYAVSCN